MLATQSAALAELPKLLRADMPPDWRASAASVTHSPKTRRTPRPLANSPFTGGESGKAVTNPQVRTHFSILFIYNQDKLLVFNPKANISYCPQILHTQYLSRYP